jgi:ElaB/YqjD/DUF883 family membrane-anchored ribosome-binding protein
MEHNDRNRDLGLGGDRSGIGDSMGSGSPGSRNPGSSAGAANTPAFGSGMDRDSQGMGSSPGAGSFGSGSGTGPGTGGESKLEEGREMVAERMEGMRNRVEEQLDSGMQTAADRMEGIAQRLDDVADERMAGEGLRGRAGDVAHRVADRIEGTAEYLRDNDAHELLGQLENKVREKPLEMLLAGVATGWLVGKIIR